MCSLDSSTDARAATPGMAAILACAWVCLALSACRSHASPDECLGAAEHYVDLAARETPGAPKLSQAQLAAVREVERGLKRAEPAFRALQDRCAEVTRKEVSCATDSATTSGWEGCFDTARR